MGTPGPSVGTAAADQKIYKTWHAHSMGNAELDYEIKKTLKFRSWTERKQPTMNLAMVDPDTNKKVVVLSSTVNALGPHRNMAFYEAVKGMYERGFSKSQLRTLK